MTCGGLFKLYFDSLSPFLDPKAPKKLVLGASTFGGAALDGLDEGM